LAARPEQRRRRDNAFLNSCTGCVHRVLDTCLLFLHLGLGGCTDLDDGDAADQFSEAFLQFLAVIVRAGLVDLIADLLDAAVDGLAAAGTLDDGRVLFVDR
jgi:hypothetical protein